MKVAFLHFGIELSPLGGTELADAPPLGIVMVAPHAA